jgi:hypothetical protein
MRMFNGRRPQFRQRFAEAHTLWQLRLEVLAQPDHAQRNRVWRFVIALLTVIGGVLFVQSRYTLPKITLPESPAFIGPLVVFALGIFVLRWMGPSLGLSDALAHWPRVVHVQTTTLQRRLHLSLALLFFRARNMLGLMALPKVLPDESITVLLNFLSVSIDTWQWRIRTPHALEPLALCWRSAKNHARDAWLTLLQYLDETTDVRGQQHLALVVIALVRALEQRTCLSLSPLGINMRC